MDGSETAKEVVFRSHGTTDLDSVHENSSEGSTVQVPAPIVDQGRTPTVTTPDNEQTVKSEEKISIRFSHILSHGIEVGGNCPCFMELMSLLTKQNQFSHWIVVPQGLLHLLLLVFQMFNA